MKNSWKILARRGEFLYQHKFKKRLLSCAKGMFAAIDVDSENFFIGKTLTEAFQRARKKFPQHKFHFVRVGLPTAVSFTHRTRP